MAGGRALDAAIKFYKIDETCIIFLNVSRDWAKKRLLSRKREDDNLEDIEKRLDWYEEDVVPVLDMYRQNENYQFLDINGEQTIGEVHEEILGKVCGVQSGH